MAKAADRIEAQNSLLLLNMLTAGTAAGFGNGDKASREIARNLKEITNG